MKMPVLYGTKIKLRPITFYDTENILRWRNSSFVKQNFIFRDDLTAEMHISWLKNKVDTGQVVQYIIEELYNHCINEMCPLEVAVKSHRWYNGGSVEKFVKAHFSVQTWERIKKAKKAGYKVYMGSLRSDNSAVECYFCTQAFVIEADSFIIDGTNDGW